MCAKFNSETMVSSKSSFPSLGLVVGATDICALAAVRSASPESWFLCPGVGAQGGTADSVCAVALRSDGSGLLVSVSRGISQATDRAAAAMKLRDDINASRRNVHEERTTKRAKKDTEVSLLDYQSQFINFALANNVLQFGSFKLKSGRISPYFFNAGLFCSGQSLNSLSRCLPLRLHT